jgi:hypothetical protein
LQNFQNKASLCTDKWGPPPSPTSHSFAHLLHLGTVPPPSPHLASAPKAETLDQPPSRPAGRRTTQRRRCMRTRSPPAASPPCTSASTPTAPPAAAAPTLPSGPVRRSSRGQLKLRPHLPTSLRIVSTLPSPVLKRGPPPSRFESEVASSRLLLMFPCACSCSPHARSVTLAKRCSPCALLCA